MFTSKVNELKTLDEIEKSFHSYLDTNSLLVNDLINQIVDNFTISKIQATYYVLIDILNYPRWFVARVHSRSPQTISNQLASVRKYNPDIKKDLKVFLKKNLFKQLSGITLPDNLNKRYMDLYAYAINHAEK